MLELVLHAQQLRAREVVSCRDIGRDRGGNSAVVVVHFLRTPLVLGSVVGLLPDFEPPITGYSVVGCRVVDSLKIHGAGAFMATIDGRIVRVRAVSPYSVLEGEGTVGLCGGNKSDADVAAHTTGHGVVGDGTKFNGIDGVGGIIVHADRDAVALVDAIDVKSCEAGVGEGAGEERKQTAKAEQEA